MQGNSNKLIESPWGVYNKNYAITVYPVSHILQKSRIYTRRVHAHNLAELVDRNTHRAGADNR